MIVSLYDRLVYQLKAVDRDIDTACLKLHYDQYVTGCMVRRDAVLESLKAYRR